MMTTAELEKVYLSRPFKIRNADEFDLANILDLFVDPTEGLIGPFEFSNSIIKGKMGSGKTMYLRANYAYYLYTLVPSLMNSDSIVLPVYIKLSDYQNIHDPEKIYHAIIIRIVEEIVSVCKHLQSADELARLHTGAHTLVGLWSTDDAFIRILESLRKLTAEEYVETVTNEFSVNGSLSAKFLNTCAEYDKSVVSEMKRCDTPAFQNIIDVCEQLVVPFNGKLLLLFDEVGSTNKRFFKSTKDSDSYFEILMNQLRTLPLVHTKLAVYPHSYSDILKETRYGDIIELECDTSTNNIQYRSFLSKTISLIERYIEKASGVRCSTEDIFDISVENQSLLEQLINASGGNMRRLVHLLDSSMNIAYTHNQGKDRITVDDVWEALRKQGAEMENQFQDADKTFLSNLAKICRTRSTYNFTFPHKSTSIGKFTSMSEEYNVINIKQAGGGRLGTVYSFDYAYCIYKDIPTHYVKDSEKIDKTRSTLTSEPIKRVAQLSDELIAQLDVRGKIEGKITFLGTDKQSGFVSDEVGKTYFVSMDSVIATDRRKQFRIGDKLRFIPSELKKDTYMAAEVEIL